MRAIGNPRARAQTAAKALPRLPAGMMYVRLVHLLDEQKRKELMFIYGEDLAPTGFTAADLKKGGKAYDQWPTIENSLVERAKNKITIENAKL